MDNIHTAWVVLVCLLLLLMSTVTTGETDFTSMADANNKFALDLYKKLIKSRQDNVFFSPFGVNSALAMTLMGAEGQEINDLRKVLHLDGVDQQVVYPSLRGLGDRFRAAGAARNSVTIASKIFLDKRHGAKKQFEIDSRLFYNSQPEILNFKSDPEAVRHSINQWAVQETGQSSLKLLAPKAVNADTKVVLANIVQFKGNWLTKFKKKATKKVPFQRAKRDMVNVQLMFQQGNFRTGTIEELQTQVLELPYNGDTLRMVILLPRRQDGLDGLENSLNSDHLKQMHNATTLTPTDVFLPKFTLEETVDVESALGTKIVLPVDGKRPKVQVKNFIHRVSLEVNESGSQESDLSVKGVQQNRIVAKHPFMFYIQDVGSGCILFLGRVKDPGTEPSVKERRKRPKKRQRDEL